MKRSSIALAVALAGAGCASVPGRDALEAQREASALEWQAQQHLAAGEWEAAVGPLRAALARAPGAERAEARRRALAVALLDAGRCDDAVAVAGDAVDYVRARCLASRGRWQEAEAAARRHASAHPRDGEGAWLQDDVAKGGAGLLTAGDVERRARARALALLAGSRLAHAWRTPPEPEWTPLAPDTAAACEPGEARLGQPDREQVERLLSLAAARDGDSWLVGYLRACVHFAAANGRPGAERVGELERGLAVLEGLGGAARARPEVVELGQRWTRRRDELARAEEAKAEFGLAVAAHARGGREGRVLAAKPGEVVQVSDRPDRCVFQIEGDGAAPEDGVDAYLVSLAAACPWRGAGPDEPVELLALPVRRSGRTTRHKLQGTVLELEVVALRHGEVVWARRR